MDPALARVMSFTLSDNSAIKDPLLFDLGTSFAQWLLIRGRAQSVQGFNPNEDYSKLSRQLNPLSMLQDRSFTP